MKLEGRRSITSEGKNPAGIDRFSALQGVKTWRGAAMMVQKPRSKEEGVRGEIMLIRCHKNILTELKIVRDVCLEERDYRLLSKSQIFKLWVANPRG
jgi:hypothetical protein